MEHNYLKEFERGPLKEHSCNPISGLGGEIFTGFLIWLQWQPEFFMEHNYLKEFERGPLKEYSCKIIMLSNQGLGGEDFYRFFTLVAMATRILQGTQLFEGI